MDRAIREKALAYAAKAVLSAAFVTACTASDATTEDDNASAPTDDEIVKGNPACKDGLTSLKEAFPTGDKRWYTHMTPDPKLVGDKDVTQCCESMVKSTTTSLAKIGKFRDIGCCAADYSAAQKANPNESPVGSACTPWGPPVPPAMIA